MTTTFNDHELLECAVDLASRAGDLALAGRKKGLGAVTTKSTATDMVTEFDHASEQLIRDGLRKARPDDGIVGEEGARDDSQSGLVWYVDPIDGTTNFFFDLPLWAVSIGGVDSEGPRVGVVHIPALGETFTAIRGEGSWLNGEKIHVRDNDQLSDALVCTGFSYSAEARVRQSRRIPLIIDKIRDLRRFGAAAVDLCFVACGRLDGYFEENLHQWDLAAGQLIATEAGALISDFCGSPVRPAEVLCATPAIHPQLISLLASVEQHQAAGTSDHGQASR